MLFRPADRFAIPAFDWGSGYLSIARRFSLNPGELPACAR
jgi:hypothetical protein